ncbi:MAG TPA: hypothetical protein VGN44_18765 [Candidatus Angelobacter sp.]|jgi:hypothetical protein
MALADSNNHFILLASLRWRLFANGLRRPNRRAELGLQVFWYVFGVGFVLFISAAFFAGTFALFQAERPDFIDLLLLLLFLIWQLAPILFEGYSPSLNFREVARYPISFRLYFLLNLAYGVSDPAALACLVWLFSMWLAVVIQQPALALPAALAFLLFAVFNLLCNRIIVGLFERFQSTRKGRERMVLITLVLLLLPQLLQFSARAMVANHSVKLPPSVLPVLIWTRAFLPSGFTARIFLFDGPTALRALAGLLILAGIVFLLLLRQLHAVFLGEIYSEAYAIHRDLTVRPGWRLPVVDEVTSAIIEKEMRYLRQNSRLVLQLIYPPIIFLLLIFNSPARKFSFATKPAGMLAGLAGFLLLSLPNLGYNIFGMDKEAFGRWLLSPLPLRKVLIAKNLTHGGLLALLYLLVAAIVIAIAHIDLLNVATVTVGFFAILILQLGAGNLISVYWPKRIELSQMNSKMASNAAGFASLLVVLPVMAISGMIAFVAWYWKLPWLPLVLGIAVLAGGLKLYSFLLDRTVAYTNDHIEEISGNLGV